MSQPLDTRLICRMIRTMHDESSLTEITQEDWYITPSTQSDAPSKPPCTPPEKPRICRGQPGHDGQTRALVPPEQINAMVDQHPTACLRCTDALSADLPDTAPVYRHQVSNIPPIEPHFTEHQVHTVCCLHGAQTVRANLPDDSYGLRPTATTLARMRHGRYRLSIRETSAARDDFFGVPMRPDSVATRCARVREALAPVYEEVEQALPQQLVAPVDETRWTQENTRS